MIGVVVIFYFKVKLYVEILVLFGQRLRPRFLLFFALSGAFDARGTKPYLHVMRAQLVPTYGCFAVLNIK